jgi:glc operon protein GlcG
MGRPDSQARTTGGARHDPPRAPGRAAVSLLLNGLAEAQKAVAASVAEAQKHDWKIAIAVVGPVGQRIVEATMDDTQYASIDIAPGKSRTPVLFRHPSKAVRDLVKQNNAAALTCLIENRGVASEGGCPIVIDGKLVGANGGSATRDGGDAKAGLDAIAGKLLQQRERGAALRPPHGGCPSTDMISCVIVS